MSRRPARCTQADIHRALKAVVQAGADMVVEITVEEAIRIARNTCVSKLVAVPIEDDGIVVL